jgi:DNA-binding GntR family transcriptional regulator
LTRIISGSTFEFRIRSRVPLQPLDTQPALIDRAYERLVVAIADGTLAAGQRIRQEELATMLGVSRQPISHALQLLKWQGLVEETGKRGLTVCGIDATRIRDLYQVRTALDALAARLAAARIAEGTAGAVERQEAQQALAGGLVLGPQDPVAAYIDADVAFHTSIYRLSGNRALDETVAAQWPHMRRSMGAVLDDPEQRPLVWKEHSEVLRLVLAGDGDAAEAAARHHTARAGAETARRIAQLDQSSEETRNATVDTAARAIR